jgi:hypothetical protein
MHPPLHLTRELKVWLNYCLITFTTLIPVSFTKIKYQYNTTTQTLNPRPKTIKQTNSQHLTTTPYPNTVQDTTRPIIISTTANTTPFIPHIHPTPKHTPHPQHHTHFSPQMLTAVLTPDAHRSAHRSANRRCSPQMLTANAHRSAHRRCSPQSLFMLQEATSPAEIQMCVKPKDCNQHYTQFKAKNCAAGRATLPAGQRRGRPRPPWPAPHRHWAAR